MLISIQYLRGFAAWAVVVEHYIETFVPAQHRIVEVVGLALLGSIGVDVFFVISGFVMAKTILSGKYSAGQFLANRMRRIVPAYWTFTLIAVMFALALGYPTKSTLFVSTEPNVSALVTSLGFIPFNEWPLLAVGWTLNFEMFFYALLAVAMLAGNKNALLISAIVTAVLPFCWPEAWLYSSVVGHFMMAYFAAGIAIGMLSSQFSVALAGAAFAVGLAYGVPGFLYTLPPFIVAVALVFDQRFQRSDLLLRLGDVSYSTYLCHFIVISLLAHFVGHAETPIEYASTAVIVVVVVYIGSVLSYNLIEKGWSRRLAGKS